MEKANLDPDAAANYLESLGLGFSKGTLAVWRSKGKGPRYRKVACRIFYRRSDLDEFAEGYVIKTNDTLYPPK